MIKKTRIFVEESAMWYAFLYSDICMPMDAGLMEAKMPVNTVCLTNTLGAFPTYIYT